MTLSDLPPGCTMRDVDPPASLFTCDHPDHYDRSATRFEARPLDPCDATWCDECAVGRTTTALEPVAPAIVDEFHVLLAALAVLA